MLPESCKHGGNKSEVCLKCGTAALCSPVHTHAAHSGSHAGMDRLRCDSRSQGSPPSDGDSCEWTRHVSSSSGKVYFYNRSTGKSQWHRPKDFSERDSKPSGRRRRCEHNNGRNSPDSKKSMYHRSKHGESLDVLPSSPLMRSYGSPPQGPHRTPQAGLCNEDSLSASPQIQDISPSSSPPTYVSSRQCTPHADAILLPNTPRSSRCPAGRSPNHHHSQHANSNAVSCSTLSEMKTVVETTGSPHRISCVHPPPPPPPPSSHHKQTGAPSCFSPLEPALLTLHPLQQALLLQQQQQKLLMQQQQQQGLFSQSRADLYQVTQLSRTGSSSSLNSLLPTSSAGLLSTGTPNSLSRNSSTLPRPLKDSGSVFPSVFGSMVDFSCSGGYTASQSSPGPAPSSLFSSASRREPSRFALELGVEELDVLSFSAELEKFAPYAFSTQQLSMHHPQLCDAAVLEKQSNVHGDEAVSLLMKEYFRLRSAALSSKHVSDTTEDVLRSIKDRVDALQQLRQRIEASLDSRTSVG